MLILIDDNEIIVDKISIQMCPLWSGDLLDINAIMATWHLHVYVVAQLACNFACEIVNNVMKRHVQPVDVT